MKNQIFKDINTLKAFEIVSSNVSKQYVPVYTSEIIDELSPTFKFIEGVRYHACNSVHSVTLQNKEGDIISIDNSYDRSRAFSLRLNYGQLTIPLDLDRVIHRGESAQLLADELLLDKEILFKAIKNAKTVGLSLKESKIPESFKK